MVRVVAPLGLLLSLVSVWGCGGPSVPDDVPGPDARTSDVGDAGVRDAFDGGTDAPMLGDVPMLDDAGESDVGEAEDAGTEPEDADLPDVMLGDAGGITCGGGQVDCGGTCTDLANDSESCGECGRTCYGTRVVGATCTSGSCAVASCELLYADANRDPSDGCEAAQDFALTTSSIDVTVNAGGSASLDFALNRINGFPYSISTTILDVPLALSINAPGPTIGSTGTLGISASPTATAATISARVVAVTIVGATTVTHEVPLTIRVVTSPVTITSVEVLRGLTPLPSNQAPQGAGPLTLRVRGTGLTAAVSASFVGVTTIALTPVAGGTATMQDYTLVVPHGVPLAGETSPLTLRLLTSGSPATFAGALVVTPITVTVAGNDFTGLGTIASPVATIERAFALANGMGDTVLLRGGGVFTPPTSVAPEDLLSLVGDGAPEIVCTGGGTGVTFAGPIEIEDLTIADCDVGIALTVPAVLFVDDVVFRDTVSPLDAAMGSTVTFRQVDLTGCGVTEIHGGSLTLQSVVTTSGFVTDTAPIEVRSSYFANIVGTALSLGASPTTHLVTQSTFAYCGVAIELAIGAQANLSSTGIGNSTSTGIRVHGGAHLRVDDLAVRASAMNGIDLDGAAPQLTVLAGGLRVTASNGLGMLVAPMTGNATLTFAGRATFEDNVGGGLEIRNPAGASTTVVNANIRTWLNDAFGIRMSGGTTTMTNALIDIDSTSRGDLGIDVVSGAGTLGFRGGTWSLPVGTALRVGPASTHTITVGTVAARTAIVLTGHPYDFHFAIEDVRTGAAAAPFIDVRADFTGSDGAPRAWTTSYRATRGSYSSDVTPRDLAAWIVRYQGGLRFVP